MWQGLDVFLAVVEHGSFSQAALTLDVSTSHVSRQIKQLENNLGVSLLQRTTRSVKLTDAGRSYATKLKLIQQELLDANAYIQGEQEHPKGPIRITGAGDFTANQVAPLLADFLSLYPKVSIELDFNNRNIDLIEEGFDLAIRFGRMKDSNLIARPLCPRNMVWAASPDYFSFYDEPLHPSQLIEHNCLTGGASRWRYLQDNELREIKVQGNWKSNNPTALVNAAIKGLGIVHLAHDIVEPYLNRGTLKQVLSGFETQDNATWLVYPRKDLIPLRVRLLIEFLIEKFK